MVNIWRGSVIFLTTGVYVTGSWWGKGSLIYFLVPSQVIMGHPHLQCLHGSLYISLLNFFSIIVHTLLKQYAFH